MRIPAARLVALFIGTAFGVFACGQDRGAFTDTSTPFVDTDASLDSAGACAGLRCSRDLESVEDGCGVVQKTCPPDQGCGDGACVAACDAAAAASGSIGCSFWTLPVAGSTEAGNGCFAVSVANTWGRALVVSADYDGEPLDISRSTFTYAANGTDLVPLSGALPPGGLAVVFLAEGDPSSATLPSSFVACPANTEPALKTFPLPRDTGTIKAFHLTTDTPASVYSIYPYGGAKSAIPSASLLLPTPSWRTSYVAVDAWRSGKSFIQVVANEDDTIVRILPTADIADGAGFTGTAQGVAASYSLARGEALQLVQTAELIGSQIEANKAVGFFGGNACMDIPEGVFFCDAAQQQIAPVEEWGSSYVLSPHRSRLNSSGGGEGSPESVPWRFVGAADGTTLTYEPSTPDGAPTTLALGETETFWTTSAFVVKSQDAAHPFYAAAYMTGASYLNGGSIGDPEFVNVIPSEQYLDRYVFAVDPTYTTSWLDLVRAKGPTGFADVELDCAGTVDGWQDVGTAGQFQRTSVKLGYGNGASCLTGRHEVHSAAAFTLTVWGIGVAASYAYPAGAGSRPLSGVHITVK